MSATPDPLVSVIIPNYNYAKYLREAVDSALSQTYLEIEVIVVDDGSNDESKQVIETYGDNVTAIFQSNQGVSAARNNGVARSSGKFVAFLDADDAWMPTKIEKQVEQFELSAEIGLVHVGVEEIDAQGKAIGQRLDGMEGRVSWDLLTFEKGVILGGGSGIMTRRAIFDEIDGFDERMSTSADWDFCYRISSRYEVGFVKEILLRYRIHGSNMHSNIGVMEHDMMLGFEKAFESGATESRDICYGNLHKTLAGSYFQSGDIKQFVRHTTKSIVKRPSNLRYFLEFPLRRLKRT